MASGDDGGGLRDHDEVTRQPDPIHNLLQQAFLGMIKPARYIARGGDSRRSSWYTWNRRSPADHRGEQRIRNVRPGLIGDLVLWVEIASVSSTSRSSPVNYGYLGPYSVQRLRLGTGNKSERRGGS